MHFEQSLTRQKSVGTVLRAYWARYHNKRVTVDSVNMLLGRCLAQLLTQLLHIVWK